MSEWFGTMFSLGAPVCFDRSDKGIVLAILIRISTLKTAEFLGFKTELESSCIAATIYLYNT